MTELNLENALNKEPSRVEEKILKAIFKKNNAIIDVIDVVTPNMFTISQYANIYEAMINLYKADNKITDETVKLWLEDNGLSVDYAIIKKIYNEGYTALKIKESGLILRELHNRRYMLSELHDIIDKQESSPTVSEDILQQINSIAIKSGEKISYNDGATRCFNDKNRVMADIEKRLKHPDLETGLETGWRSIDGSLGGFYRGQCICLCASSGAGKSWISWETCIQMCLANPKLKALYFSLEMEKDELEDRGISILSGIPTDAIQRPRKYFQKYDEYGILHDYYLEDTKVVQEFKNKVKNAVDILSSLNITIDDEGGLKIEDVLARIQRFILKNGGVDLIFIDHTYLLRNMNKDMGTSDEFGDIYYSLKNTAKKYNCVVYALHQLNMEVKNNSDRRPSIYNIRGSSQIIDNCDVLMLLYNSNIHKDLIRQNPELKDIIDITFGKVRSNRLPDNIDLKFTSKGLVEKEPDDTKGNITSYTYLSVDGSVFDPNGDNNE